MTTNEIMLALHKMIGLADQEPSESHCILVYDGSWGLKDATGMGSVLPFPAANALIEKAAIEWLDTRVDYFCIEHDTGQLWEVQWEMPGKDYTRVATGPTLLEALHAAVKEAKHDN